MTQMKKARADRKPIDGWFILDKPLGLTSTQAVGALRRRFHPEKIGHGGTLDPLATGVLPVAMGEATKTVPYLMDATKDYAFSISWGAETDTDDAEGEITRRQDAFPSAAAVGAVLDRFRGSIMQAPPRYSAVKLGGQRAYDLARRNREVNPAPRPVHIHHLQIVSHEREQTDFIATTGKGAYIRALGRDIARAAGGAAYISALRRLRVGPFHIDQSISLDFLDGIKHSAALEETLFPLESALDDIPALILDGEEAERLYHGQQIDIRAETSADLVLGKSEETPVALIRIEQGKGQPVRVFNLKNRRVVPKKEISDVDYPKP